MRTRPVFAANSAPSGDQLPQRGFRRAGARTLRPARAWTWCSTWSGAITFRRNLSVLRRDGRLVLIAFQRGTRAELDFNPVLRNRLVITGSTMRPRTLAEKTAIRDALRREVWPAWRQAGCAPMCTRPFRWHKPPRPTGLMESSRHVGKILLRLR